MNKSIITKGRNLNSVLSLSGFVLVSLLVIVWFLPRNNTPQMRYDVGKPWMYASLIAKFDFPVYKSDAVIQQEKDSLLAYFQPYYNYDKGMERRQLGKLHADYPRGIPGLPAAQMRTLYDRLHRLYQAGIISTPQYNSIAKDSVNMVRVIIGKRVQSMQIGCIYSTLKAYEQLLRDNVLADYRMVLQQANVVSYLQPNMTYDKNRTTTELNDLLGSVPLASGMVLSGQKIIDRGEIVNDYSYRVLASLEKETARRNVSKAEIKNTVIGQFIYVLMLLCLFTCFIVMFRPQYLGKARSVVMLYVMITV